jgi:hypothetical protein
MVVGLAHLEAVKLAALLAAHLTMEVVAAVVTPLTAQTELQLLAALAVLELQTAFLVQALPMLAAVAAAHTMVAQAGLAGQAAAVVAVLEQTQERLELLVRQT